MEKFRNHLSLRYLLTRAEFSWHRLSWHIYRLYTQCKINSCQSLSTTKCCKTEVKIYILNQSFSREKNPPMCLNFSNKINNQALVQSSPVLAGMQRAYCSLQHPLYCFTQKTLKQGLSAPLTNLPAHSFLILQKTEIWCHIAFWGGDRISAQEIRRAKNCILLSESSCKVSAELSFTCM